VAAGGGAGTKQPDQGTISLKRHPATELTIVLVIDWLVVK